MLTFVRIPICLVFLIGLAGAFVSLPAAVLPAQKANCCAKTEIGNQENDCRKQMPKSESEPEKQCCAACAVGLTLFLGTIAPLITPPAAEKLFASFSCKAHVRSERPPVPPPRLAFV